MLRSVVVLAMLLGLSACGGGGNASGTLVSAGGAGGGSSVTGTSPNGWVAGVFQPSSKFANQCAAPRSGTDPVNQKAYPDTQGTATDENNFLRSWTNELYLWYSEVPDLNPASYTTAAYFPLLKTSATTASGNAKDKFHFTYPTSTWEQLSQAGVQLGYGAIFVIQQASPPRKIVVAYVQPSTTDQPGNPALAAGLMRGDSIVSIDGVSVDTNDQAGVDTLNEGLSPTTTTAHTFVFQPVGTTTSQTVSLTPATVTEAPVPIAMKIPVGSQQVGYILFNDHIATSEKALIDAVNTVQGASDLFLDIRYNGGGFLDIADELAFMIAGPTPTAGRTFEKVQFNDKNPLTNPVTGEPLTPTPFHTTTEGFSVTAGQPLPHLDLQTVYVLTTSDTCSASESIINSLRGVGVNVIQVGSTTCGKPYGFYPQDNCGTTYFSIEFKGVNDVGFGDYSDGFSPRNTVSNIGALVDGCSVADDFTHALGDQNETLLSTALGYRLNKTCPVPPSGLSRTSLKRAGLPGLALTARSPLREMRILGGPSTVR